MDANQFSIEIAKKFQKFFAHMDQFCQQFLKGQNVFEIHQTEKKEKKERDPDQPKKPLTPFFLFSQKYREKVLERNPEVKLTQISQMAGIKWKSMTEQEKQPYHDQYIASKEKYDNEIKDYNDKHGIVVNEKKKKKSDKFDDKSMKSTQEHHLDDFESESVQPAAKHQQQIKQTQQVKKNKQESDEEEHPKAQKATPKQQQNQKQSIQVKTKKAPVQIDDDDDIQKQLDQVVNQDKPATQNKKSKK